ncbi:MAG TPA: hypothetical protein VHD87_16300 [Acidimicrobiales bacterium]|nr:hypothetical protein [Acidimicrobiales bacterium]
MLRGPEIALLVVGAALVAAAVVWRAAVRLRARRRVRQLLRAPEASARRSALDLLGNDGLSAHANALVDLVAHEHDPSVLDAVADLVARNSWEPADQPRLIELRLWARGRLSAQQTQTAPLAPARSPRPQPEPAPAPHDEPRPLRLDGDPLLRRLERALGERVLAVRIQRPDGTVELDVFDPEGAAAWR